MLKIRRRRLLPVMALWFLLLLVPAMLAASSAACAPVALISHSAQDCRAQQTTYDGLFRIYGLIERYNLTKETTFTCPRRFNAWSSIIISLIGMIVINGIILYGVSRES